MDRKTTSTAGLASSHGTRLLREAAFGTAAVAIALGLAVWVTDFDLAAYWQAATMRLEAEMHPNYATVRLSPFGIKLLNALTQPYVRTRTRIEETADAAGWRIAVVPIGKTVWHAAAELLRLGAEAEVLAPAELRDKMTEFTRAMAARYRTAQDGYQDDKDVRQSSATKHS